MFDVMGKMVGVVEEIFMYIIDSLIAPFKAIDSLRELVFGVSDSDLIWDTFQPDNLTNGLSPMYNTMMSLAAFVVIIAIVLTGIRIGGSGMNPARRNEMFESAKDLMLVMILLFNLPFIYDVLFSLNSGILKVFSGALESNLDDLQDEKFDDVSGILGFLFVQLVLVGLAVWANFYYLMRKVTLLILLALGPLMVAFWLIPSMKSLTGAWFKELIGSIFIQSIHAFVFWTVYVVSATSDGFIETVIVYVIFIPISESIRRLLNMGGEMQGGLSKAGAMFGMASLAAMGGAVKGAFKGESVGNVLKSAYDGAKGKKGSSGAGAEGENKDLSGTIGAGAGSDSGTSVKAEKMLKSGDFMSKLGKATIGAAGGIAGAGLGPVGAIAGASIGSIAGGAVGGVTGRVGAAGVQGIANRMGKGKDALNALKVQDGDFKMTDALANSDTANWAKENKDKVMSNLQEKFPDATKAELDKKFEGIQERKKAEFTKSAKSDWASAKSSAKDSATGAQLLSTAPSAMGDKWAKDNEEKFNEEYDKQNPRPLGMSHENHLKARKAAFGEKKAHITDSFRKAGEDYLSENGGSDTLQSKAKFASHMSKAVNGMDGVQDADGLVKAGSNALAHVQGVSLAGQKGIPNGANIASQIATVRMNNAARAFANSKNTPDNQLEGVMQSWKKENGNEFRDSQVQAMQSNGFINSAGSIKSLNSPSAIGKSLAFAGGVSGVPNGIKALGNGISNVGIAGAIGKEAFNQANTEGQGFIRSSANALGASYGAFQQAGIEQAGGAVEAHQAVQNAGGYVGGIILGAKGHQIGKNLATKMSMYSIPAQREIQSPSEVIQMARTVTDDNGVTSVAPGAIRQVITPNESYIEVQTKGGETQRVSRLAAGHSGLKKGETVYQDLDVQGDSIVPVTSKSGSSTYRMDSGGAKVPSDVQVTQNPNTLLGSPSMRQGGVHRPVERPNVPVYSQKVESGNFFTEDIAAQGMSNPQVVIEKDRQFVTAQKDGQTYRVSPIYAGDTRVGSQQSITVPVAVKNNKLRPTMMSNSEGIKVLSNTSVSDYDDVSSGVTQSYFSSQNVNTLMVGELLSSKNLARAEKSVERRNELDIKRRKQGLLG